jgi:hypothetical protein
MWRTQSQGNAFFESSGIQLEISVVNRRNLSWGKKGEVRGNCLSLGHLYVARVKEQGKCRVKEEKGEGFEKGIKTKGLEAQRKEEKMACEGGRVLAFCFS